MTSSALWKVKRYACRMDLPTKTTGVLHTSIKPICSCLAYLPTEPSFHHVLRIFTVVKERQRSTKHVALSRFHNHNIIRQLYYHDCSHFSTQLTNLNSDKVLKYQHRIHALTWCCFIQLHQNTTHCLLNTLNHSFILQSI